MPLRSKLFQGDPALERCLVSDPAHVLSGARGQHVGKIQRALVMIGAGTIGPAEVAGALYGATTARTVLAFKTQRRILGPHQRTPDDIVGKLTIQALDAELAELENRPDPNPPPSSRLVSLTMAGAPHDHTRCPLSDFPGPDGRVHHLGTPINPQGFGRKINIGGEHETDYLGFEDFTTDPISAGPKGRPLTSTLRDSCASDICLRSSPITTRGEAEIARIAMSACRLTVATNTSFLPTVEAAVTRLGTIVERQYLVDFAPSDGLGYQIVVAVMRAKPLARAR